jgi:UDP-N-acetylglucosamine 2-epimerase (non-hydrolysing)
MLVEAPALIIPRLILRDRTERPGAIASGNMLLVGRYPDLIEKTVARLLDDPATLSAMRRPSYP